MTHAMPLGRFTVFSNKDTAYEIPLCLQIFVLKLTWVML